MKREKDNSVISDFKDILQSEVYVDLERLRMLSRHGIPDHLRSETWKYLLGVQQADRSRELSLGKARTEEYEQMDKMDNETAKRIRGEVIRYQRRVPELEGKEKTESFVNIILAYLNANRDIEYSPGLVSLCAPFIYVMKTECDAYYCFEKLLQDIDEHDHNMNIKEQLAHFMTLFRYSLPELSSYFEDEEVDLNEWATSWLQYLLSREMRFENLVRLWDCYFSIHDPFQFHPFVCLSILLSAREELEDLEQSEIRTMLLRLPALNMDMIIADAYDLRHKSIERQMSEDEM
ncbi:rab-GTPase-TBC domain-containing protein [Pilobolus umbonatus]|nr:rab-GTPase-TBC domain-containing protein [Pilobolus umbonatus]